MKLKSLSLLGLLATAPMASQAAMVEMNETEMSDVSGQVGLSGLLFNYSASFAWNPSYSAPHYDADRTAVLGGVQRDSTFSVKAGMSPSWTFGVTGKYSGTPYVGTDASATVDFVDISYARSRIFRLK